MHPMARGCYKGELNVCKWLYDNGAAEDINKATNHGYDGFTPMHEACTVSYTHLTLPTSLIV